MESEDKVYHKVDYVKVIYFGLCFMILFGSYATAQSYLTTIYPDIGFYSFCCIYVFHALGTLLGGYFIRNKYIWTRLMFFISSFSFVLWVLSLVLGNMIFILIASAMNGFGAGLLWIQQGYYLGGGEFDIEHMGTYNGIFMLLFHFSNIFGNVIAVIVLTYGNHINSDQLLWVLFALVCLGNILFVFLPKNPREKAIISTTTIEPTLNPSNNCGCRCPTPLELMISGYSVHLGISVCFVFSVMSLALKATRIEIAYIFIAYGVGAGGASILNGWLYDRDWKSTILVHILLLLMQMMVFNMITNVITILPKIVMALLSGCVDGSSQTLIASTISKVRDREGNLMANHIAFKTYRLLFCVSFAIMSIIAKYVEYTTTYYTSFAFAILSPIIYLLSERELIRYEPPEQIDSSNV
jgi:predicted MFS family arabinose efflux permease